MDSDEEDGAFEEDLVGDIDVGAGAEEVVEGFEDGGLEEDESEEEEDEVWEEE